MASHPDANPDSDPSGPSDSPEQVTPPDDGGREGVEESADGLAGPAGSGGENKVQDQSFEQ